MNAKETFLAANAHVHEAANQPLTNSRKIYRLTCGVLFV